MSWLSNLFKGGKNPADAAMPYLNQIAPMEQANYYPFITRGDIAYQGLRGPYDKMSTDPAGFLEEILKGYEPSRAYGLKRDEMERAAGNTAAAGGMRGSLQDITNESRIADSLLGEDMQQWLQNVLGIQGRGLEGEQHLYDTGFDATKSMTGDIANVLGTQGSLAFQGQANKNRSQSDLLSGIVKALGGRGWIVAAWGRFIWWRTSQQIYLRSARNGFSTL